MLLWRGHWGEAERELTGAALDLEASRPPSAAESTVRLAELRRRQGNFEEAEHLFRAVEFHPMALLGLAELALDTGKPQHSKECIERYLRHIPAENKTQRAPALELLVRAEVALGDTTHDQEIVLILQTTANLVPTNPVRASIHLAGGIVAAAAEEYDAARQHLEDAVLYFEKSDAPYETGRARIELAHVLLRLDRREAAEREARTALAMLEEIGAMREAKRAFTLLHQLESSRRRSVELLGTDARLTQREVEVLRFVARGMSDKEIASSLHLSEHTTHRHIANILTKLDVPTRAAAVALGARSAGIL